MDDEGDQGGCRDGADGDEEHVIAKSLLLCRCFTLHERFVVRTEDFAEQRHPRLCKQNTHQPEDK